jgi:hypothetical protein
MRSARPGSGTLLRRLRLRPIAEERPAFVEGLLIGSMVGAAIAGSTLWARLRASRPVPDNEPSGPERHSPEPSRMP